MITITRTQFPVGQGGFHHGEIHSSSRKVFSWIFDCGTLSSSKYIINCIQEIKNEIDIFYLSHFHSDHYSGIHLLAKNNIKVKKFIIPYSSIEERLIFAITNPQSLSPDKIIDQESLDFLFDPVSHLSELFEIDGSNIIQVQNNNESRYITQGDYGSDILYSEESISIEFSRITGNVSVYNNSEGKKIWEIITYTPKKNPQTNIFFGELLAYLKGNFLIPGNSKLDAYKLEKIFNNRTFWHYIFRTTGRKYSNHRGLTGYTLKVFYEIFCKIHNIQDGVNGCNISIFSGLTQDTLATADVEITAKFKGYSGHLTPWELLRNDYICLERFPETRKMLLGDSVRDGWVLPGDDFLADGGRLSDTTDKFKPVSRVSVFSAPHHGSDNSWNPDILNYFHNTYFLLIHSQPGYRKWRHPGDKLQVDCSNGKALMLNITNQTNSKFQMITSIHI